VVVTVHNTVLNAVDDRLFGQFMERASGGEPGYDAARDPEHPRALRPDVVEKLAWLNIPVVRWPAGSDLPKIDWRDAIDNVPGREGARPSFGSGEHPLSNEFGLDEFLALSEKLGWAPLLPVRIERALLGDVTPEAGAAEAAGLVAYCNAEVGAKLPEGMPDWPAVRARNGRAKPWKVSYFQIGNETWFCYKEALKRRGLESVADKEKAKWYVTCLRAYLTAMRAVDPNIQVIMDGVTGAGRWVDEALFTDPFVRQHIAFYALHLYQPWGITEVRRGDKVVPLDRLTAEEAWYAWVTTPSINRETFQSELPGYPEFWMMRALGLPVAITEWNWNGWWGKTAPLQSELAKGLGAAGMLHAFMRQGDQVRIGCQSMLVGTNWGIAGVRLAAGKTPRIRPTAMATGLYSRYHGRERLLAELTNMPTFPQPLQMGFLAPEPRVAFLDVVVTRRDRTLFIHAINRHMRDAISTRFDLRRLGGSTGGATLHTLTGPVEPNAEAGYAAITEKRIKARGHSVLIEFPARSISVAEIPIR
jgi:alpha-N-arabinofuranosidase